MKILGLDWVGTRTTHFRETVAFFEKILGLPVGKRQDDFVRLDLPDSSVVEVFGPGDKDHLFFTTGPAVGFLVSDFDAARTELAGEGLELLGPPGGEVGEARWQHFRAPDGCVYEVVKNPDRHAPGTSVGPLQITRLAWMGTRTARYDETRSFFGRFLGLGLVAEEPDLAEYGLPDGSTIEVFRPGAAVDYPQFSTGPVPGFGVQNIEVAVKGLRSRKIPLLQTNLNGPVGWAHFRGPDGCVYEIQGPPISAGVSRRSTFTRTRHPNAGMPSSRGPG